jgi:hypothetical protein
MNGENIGKIGYPKSYSDAGIKQDHKAWQTDKFCIAGWNYHKDLNRKFNQWLSVIICPCLEKKF